LSFTQTILEPQAPLTSLCFWMFRNVDLNGDRRYNKHYLKPIKYK